MRGAFLTSGRGCHPCPASRQIPPPHLRPPNPLLNQKPSLLPVPTGRWSHCPHQEPAVPQGHGTPGEPRPRFCAPASWPEAITLPFYTSTFLSPHNQQTSQSEHTHHTEPRQWGPPLACPLWVVDKGRPLKNQTTLLFRGRTRAKTVLLLSSNKALLPQDLKSSCINCVARTHMDSCRRTSSHCTSWTSDHCTSWTSSHCTTG